MDIRVTETVATSGALAETGFRIDGSLETVSLTYDAETDSLNLIDTNLNYALLPEQLYTGLVKKVFLTYNGRSGNSGPLLETVVLESNSSFDDNQIPGYANSNTWSFIPKLFSYRTELLEMTDPDDYTDWPYDQSQGFTIVKQFLTAGGMTSPLHNLNGQPLYKAFFRAPTISSFLPANVEHNHLYIDGWYTSYVCAARTWETLNSYTMGTIVYYAPAQKFYVNVTGEPGALMPNPDTSLQYLIPDSTNWKENPNFGEWKTFMQNNLNNASSTDPLFFLESQHLVTFEINAAIKKELINVCSACHHPGFRISQITDYMRLYQKRLGAWIKFNEGMFHESAAILATARKLCYMCLYQDKCLTTPNNKC
jgi:hypothetical protein